MKFGFLSFIVLVVLALASDDANARHGNGGGGKHGGGKKCPAGVTFNMCYQHCIDLSGTARTDMMKCSKRCSNRGCL